MRALSRGLTFVIAVVFVLGVPPAILLTSDAPPGTPELNDPLQELVAQQSTLADRYQRWEDKYVRAGGDSQVVLRLGWALGLSEADFTPAAGELQLDLLSGELQARVEGLPFPTDLWLVDNLDHPGHSAAPEAEDRLVRIGRLNPQGEIARLEASLGEDFFQDFFVDLAVVTPAGESPVDGGVLFGSRSLFERIYTEQRMVAEANAPSLLRSLTPSGIAEMFTPQPAQANSTSILVSRGLVSALVGEGAELFFRGTFSGNGRTCGTCHPVENNQTIDLPFINSLPASDRLFIAELPASEGGVPGLENPALMRNHGLIIENLDGAENPTVKLTMRSVPHSLSMATSIEAPADGRAPLERTGWSGDGAPMTGELRFFSMGAVFQHFTKSLKRVENVDFVFPTDAELDAMEAFMRTVGRVPNPPEDPFTLSNITFSDAGAEAGKVVFLNQGKCNGCHGNATAISAFGGNRNFNTGVEDLVNPAQATSPFPGDGGFGLDPRDCDGDGTVGDCFGDGTFNTMGLIEAADTPPFFHNNVVQTVEGAVAFYSGPEFNNSPAGALVGGVSLTAQEVDDVAAMMRVLNAAFNIDIALQRVIAARSLENSSVFSKTASSESDGTNGTRATVNTLLALAVIEAVDAIEVLDARGLHPTVVQDLLDAIADAEAAIDASGSRTRARLMDQARTHLESARPQLGSGMNYVMGEANLLF